MSAWADQYDLPAGVARAIAGHISYGIPVGEATEEPVALLPSQMTVGVDPAHSADAFSFFAAAFLNKATTPGDWSAMSFAECQKPPHPLAEYVRAWREAVGELAADKAVKEYKEALKNRRAAKPAINGLLTTYTDRHG